MTDDQTPDQTPEPSKIIIDDDWKKQAQAEKEQIAEQAKADKPAEGEAQTPDQAGDAAPGPDGQQPRQIPPASFTTLVSSIATQAIMALGGFADPNSEKVMVDVELAKHHIDTLKVLEAKTKGNLDEEESKLMEQASYQVQMMFVQVIQHLSGQEPGQDPTGGSPLEQPSN
jgi:hypothetical protein